MLQARGFFRATLLQNGQVLLEGGMLKDQSLTAQSEIFDPTRGIWRKTYRSLNEARAKHTATLLPDGKVLVTGGYGPLQSAELYDPASETWTLTKVPMKYARARHTATMLQHGKVLISGGSPYNNNNTAELYNPATEAWASIQSMMYERADFTAVVLPDGRVLVIGGRMQNSKVTSTTEIFNPHTGSWQQGPNMNHERLNPLGQEALQCEDGTILVVGGDTLGTSERYIPATDKWISVLRLHSQHYRGATAILSNGRAFVAGGFKVLSTVDKGELTTSTEIYMPGSE